MESKNTASTFVSRAELPRMPFKGIAFLALCWLLFFAIVIVQFLSLGLIPVLAPVLVTVILIQAGLLQRAHQLAEGWRVAPVEQSSRSAAPAVRALVSSASGAHDA